MIEPRWLTVADVVAMHAEQLALFGGPAGIRDQAMLESAVARPLNQWHYEQARLPALAAAYAFGIARNHPFVDGNKRAAFAAMMAFLRLNKIAFKPSQPAASAIMLELAAGTVGEDGLTHWMEDNWPTGK
jgi:death on curing protein